MKAEDFETQRALRNKLAHEAGYLAMLVRAVASNSHEATRDELVAMLRERLSPAADEVIALVSQVGVAEYLDDVRKPENGS